MNIPPNVPPAAGWGASPPVSPNTPPAPPAAPPAHPKHYCFSGSPVCSGCVPCPACLIQVRTYVLPPAMGAAGFAGDPRQAQAFFDAYTRAGWPRLHHAMNHDPSLQGRFAGVDVVAMLQELAEFRAEAVARTQAAASVMSDAAPLGAPVPAPPWLPVQTPPAAPPLSDPSAPTLNAAAPPAPVPSPPEGLPSGTWVQEMTVEDVMAAGEPLPVTPPDRAVLGNVMVVPPGMEHHLNGGMGPGSEGGG